MTTIYIKDENGKRIEVFVTDEVAAADAETRRAEWRNEVKERYHRNSQLNGLNERDEEYGSDELNPEALMIAAEAGQERCKRMIAVLKTLTARQIGVVKLLNCGKTVTEIAVILGITKQSVGDIRKAVQKKFKEFLKSALQTD